MAPDQIIQTIALAAIPVLFAITLHEVAHGYAARHFGDFTAQQAGRLSLNPMHHIDWVGTVLLPMVSLALGGILFGWAKPVPVNFGALRRPKQDMLWVALAGPLANLAMALMWALLLRLALTTPDGYFSAPLQGMAQIGIQINLILLVLNLLPLPPLDGGRIAISLLPPRQAFTLAKLEPYGMVVLIVLAFSGVLGEILSPLYHIAERLLGVLSGV